MMRKHLYCSTKLYLLKSICIGVISLFILTGANCPRNGSAPPSIEVTKLPTKTLLAGGNIGLSGSYIVGKQHRYQVEVKVKFLTENANFNPPDTGVSIIWINPFNNNEEFARANLKPGTDDIYTFILPNSENLDLCQAYFYRWSIVYNLVDAERGVYLGEAHYEMPTKKQISPNSIQQATCAAPTSPWGI